MSYKRYALVLGINEYRDPEIQPLAGAKADALAMYVFLLTQLRFDRAQLVEPEQSHIFLDLVEKWAGELTPQDLLVVFYAGHGYEVNHKHFLLTPTDRISRLKADLGAMHKEALVHAMRGQGCHRVLITDSCRSALLGARSGPVPRGHNAVDRDLGQKEAKETQGSLTLFNACDEGKTAAELKQLSSGLFTRSLLQVWEAKLAAGKIITVDSGVQQEVAVKMRETAAQFGLDGDQYPWLLSSGWAPPLREGASAPGPSAAAPNPPPPQPVYTPRPPPAQPVPTGQFGAGIPAAFRRFDYLNHPRGPRRTLVTAIIVLMVLNWLFHSRGHWSFFPWPHWTEERGRR